MPQYLLSVYTDGLDYGEFGGYESEEQMQQAFADTGAFNERLEASGQLVFAGGLNAPSTASVVDATSGSTTITDGPYGESKEHIGGFWIIEAPDLDAALKLAEEGSAACLGAVEVVPFQSGPDA